MQNKWVGQTVLNHTVVNYRAGWDCAFGNIDFFINYKLNFIEFYEQINIEIQREINFAFFKRN